VHHPIQLFTGLETELAILFDGYISDTKMATSGLRVAIAFNAPLGHLPPAAVFQHKVG